MYTSCMVCALQNALLIHRTNHKVKRCCRVSVYYYLKVTKHWSIQVECVPGCIK